MKDTLTLKDTKMVVAKLIARDRCTWSFEEVAVIMNEIGYRNPASQVRPFLRNLRDLEMWHPISMFAERFAGQYLDAKNNARETISALDEMRLIADYRGPVFDA